MPNVTVRSCVFDQLGKIASDDPLIVALVEWGECTNPEDVEKFREKRGDQPTLYWARYRDRQNRGSRCEFGLTPEEALGKFLMLRVDEEKYFKKLVASVTGKDIQGPQALKEQRKP